MADIIILVSAIIKDNKIVEIKAENKEQNLVSSGVYYVTKGKDNNTIKFSDIIIDSNGEKKTKYIKDYKVLSYYYSHGNSCDSVNLDDISNEPSQKGENNGEKKASNMSIEKAIEIVTKYVETKNLLEAKFSDIVKAIENDRAEQEKKQEESLEKQIEEMQKKLESLRQKKAQN